jgi:hypothetical protein
LLLVTDLMHWSAKAISAKAVPSSISRKPGQMLWAWDTLYSNKLLAKYRRMFQGKIYKNLGAIVDDIYVAFYHCAWLASLPTAAPLPPLHLFNETKQPCAETPVILTETNASFWGSGGPAFT